MNKFITILTEHTYCMPSHPGSTDYLQCTGPIPKGSNEDHVYVAQSQQHV